MILCRNKLIRILECWNEEEPDSQDADVVRRFQQPRPIDGISNTTVPVLTMAYPTMVTDPDGFSSSAKYSYDLGLGTRKQDPKGAAQTTQYDSAGRVKQVTNTVNGAYTRFVYPTSQLIVNQFAMLQENAGEAYSATVFDGAGRVRATVADFPDAVPHYSGRYTDYDGMGRAISQSNPIEINSNWTATGADAAVGGFGWVFVHQTYDWKGRPLVTTNTDNTTKTAATPVAVAQGVK